MWRLVRAQTANAGKDEGAPRLSRAAVDYSLQLVREEQRSPDVRNALERLASRDPRLARMVPVISFSGNEANPLFHNTGSGFVEIGTTLGASRLEDGRGFVLVDLDQDGSLDLVLHNYYKNPIVALLNRAASGNHWLRFNLRGTRSNRFGIGARVTVGNQVQEMVCGTGFLTGNPPQLHFGLGKSETASVTVRWPSGQVDRYEALPADRLYTLVEGAPASLTSAAPQPLPIDAGRAEGPGGPRSDGRAILGDLLRLDGTPSPVSPGPVATLAILFSVDCQACRQELQRAQEIEEEAARSGGKVVWIAVDADPGRIQERIKALGSKIVPFRAGPKTPPCSVPCAWLLTPANPEKAVGPSAVQILLSEMKRLGMAGGKD